MSLVSQDGPLKICWKQPPPHTTIKRAGSVRTLAVGERESHDRKSGTVTACGLEGLGRRLHLHDVQSTALPHCETARYAEPTAPRSRPWSSLTTCCLPTLRHYLQSQSALIAPHPSRVRISSVIFRLDWWTHQLSNGLLQQYSTLFIYNFHHLHLELFSLWFRLFQGDPWIIVWEDYMLCKSLPHFMIIDYVLETVCKNAAFYT